MSDVFFENDAVDVLALILVGVLKGDDLDEGVEIDGIVEQSWAWPDGLDGVLGGFDDHAPPSGTVDFEVFDYLVNHLLHMLVKFFVDP